MRGDVYWVDLHGDGTAVRPYLVLQSDALNDVVSSTIAVPLTLAPQKAGPPLTIELDPGESGLDEPTWIRVTKPQTLPTDRFTDRTATLSPERLAQVVAALSEVLELS